MRRKDNLNLTIKILGRGEKREIQRGRMNLNQHNRFKVREGG